MAAVDILLPTCNRPESFLVTLCGVASQSLTDIRVIVADQSDEPADRSSVVGVLCQLIEHRGGSVEWHHRYPPRGIAEQRDFLLDRATAQAMLYLDDDVFMQPAVVERLFGILREQGCAFVGAFPVQLRYLQDYRPQQERIEYWDGPVGPEVVEPDSPQWQRAGLHSAANLEHVAEKLQPGEFRLYKVAWVASCILYDRAKLLEVGGFSFWERLPRWHSGEEVVVQNLLMRKWGGCAVVPSETTFTEMPSTVLNERGTVDGHAVELLPEMVERYASRH